MNVQLVVHQPPAGKFTNLDHVTGKVVLRVPKQTNISNITVKLEGESTTRIEDPDWGGQRGLAKEESHRLLYKMERVFPPKNTTPTSGLSYMLNPGIHEYTFSFKMPFNNSCLSNPAPATGSFVLAQKHIKATLPPSMHVGLEATIRYFVKVTVNVPSFFRENPRSFSFFNFDPIEPPRKPAAGEAFARRTHQFKEIEFPNPSSRRQSGNSNFSFFKSRSNNNSSESTSLSTPLPDPKFSIEFRLPNPAILTCGSPIPLRIILKTLTTHTKPLFLQSIMLELIGFTKIRAQEVEKVTQQNWVLLNKNNLHRTLGSESDAAESEQEILADWGRGISVPDSACSEFVTCNVARWYELHLRMGLSYGTKAPGKDQFVIMPLKQNVSIYSGIAPPTALLERMANGRPLQHIDSDLSAANIPPPSLNANHSSASVAGPSSGGRPRPPAPQQATTSTGEPLVPAPPYDEPPPSYEDAMADNLTPANGIGPGYRPPDPNAGGADTSGIWRDEK